MTESLTTICAWCSPPTEQDAHLSHGICQRHLDEMMAALPAKKGTR